MKSVPRPWRRRLLAAAGSLAVASLAAEGIVRAIYGAPLPERLPLLEVRAHPRRGWEMTPSKEHYTYTHRVHVNGLGLRGPEVLLKRPGERRVLALGDSLVYGQGVADDQTIPAHLERALRERGGDWSAVNGGLRGYSTHQELALLEELGERIEPDAVILFWYSNDLAEPDLETRFQSLQASGPIAFDLGAPPSAAALRRWRRVQVLRRSALAMQLHDVWRAARATPPQRDFIDCGLQRLDGHLARFKTLASERGFRAIVAAIPSRAALDGPHPSIEQAARVKELAGRHGLAFVDLLEPLRRARERLGRKPVLPYDGHYDPQANQAMAGKVAGLLLDDAPPSPAGLPRADLRE